MFQGVQNWMPYISKVAGEMAVPVVNSIVLEVD